jgi:hypothetical protein
VVRAELEIGQPERELDAETGVSALAQGLERCPHGLSAFWFVLRLVVVGRDRVHVQRQPVVCRQRLASLLPFRDETRDRRVHGRALLVGGEQVEPPLQQREPLQAQLVGVDAGELVELSGRGGEPATGLVEAPEHHVERGASR